MPEAERFEDLPGLLLARWENVAISSWTGAVEKRHLDALVHSLDVVSRASPSGFVALALVPSLGSKISPLTAEQRSHLLGSLARHEQRLLGVAVAIEAGGFVGSVTRSVLAGMGLLLRRPYPAKSFADRQEASAFLTPLAARVRPAASNAAALLRNLEELVPRSGAR